MRRHLHPVCGRCGVYRHLHPTKAPNPCTRPRHSFWLDEHAPLLHLRGWAWTKVPERARWRVINAMRERFPDRWHWCHLVDAALLMSVEDYRDDWCDVPTPFGVEKPPTTACYCNDVVPEGWADWASRSQP